jgi:hypothetical protein
MRSNNEEDNLAKTIQFIALIFIAFLMVLALTPTYRIQNGASADLLWNKNEAYIFVNTYHKGWQMSSLHYLGATLGNISIQARLMLRSRPQYWCCT